MKTSKTKILVVNYKTQIANFILKTSDLWCVDAVCHRGRRGAPDGKEQVELIRTEPTDTMKKDRKCEKHRKCEKDTRGEIKLHQPSS